MSQLNWGLIGGGRGSQIGPAHRLGARVDGLFRFAAGALVTAPKRAGLTESSWVWTRIAAMAIGEKC